MKKYRIFFNKTNYYCHWDNFFSFFLIPTINFDFKEGIEWDRVIGLNIYIFTWEFRLGIQYNKK